MRRHLTLVSAQAATLGHRLAAWLTARRMEGQGLVEYGLILVLIMVVCVGILTLTGETISEVWYDRLIQRLP
jgi:hypothetical protein